MNGFGGQDQEKLKPDALLPYKPADQQDQSVMSEATIECFKRLYQKRRVSIQVLSSAIIAHPPMQRILEQL